MPLVSPSSHEMNEFEKEEMKKSRSLVKNKLNEWYDCLVDHVPKPIKNTASKNFLGLKNGIIRFYDNTAYGKEGDIYYEKVEMPFNSLMTKFFDTSAINDLIERMLAYIKAQTENPKFPESGFTMDKIMHLYIKFHRLALTRGSSYIELPKWLKSKKAVINRQNKDEECFKWAVIAALHHEEIKKDQQHISRLRPYENQYNWKGLEFSVPIKKIDKFERNNLEIPLNVLFSNKKIQKKNICTVHRSGRNVKCKKQVNLLMIVDGEKRHYTTIKGTSRLLKSLNATHKGAYHFCMNCLKGFWTESARDKHYEYCSSNGHIRVRMSTEKEHWLKFHDEQYQLKVPFILYADFESILKPVDERYRDSMNTMETEKKDKTSHTEKISTHVPSGVYTAPLPMEMSLTL